MDVLAKRRAETKLRFSRKNSPIRFLFAPHLMLRSHFASSESGLSGGSVIDCNWAFSNVAFKRLGKTQAGKEGRRS